MEISSFNRQKIAKQKIATTYAALFVFGVAYDQIVTYLEENALDDGYTSDLVVIGTAVTLLGALPLIGLRKTALALGAFIASGIPTAVGSKIRYRRRRTREARANGNGKRERIRTAGDGRPGAATWEQSEAETGCSGASGNGRVGRFERDGRIA